MLKEGEIALAKKFCYDPSAWHVAILTQEGLHPGCVEVAPTRDYSYTSAGDFSVCLRFEPGEGKFVLKIRWDAGHSPYPEIKMMHVWAFGIDLGSASYPKAKDWESKHYKKVANIEVDKDGYVTVNGKDAGFWPDMMIL